MAEDYDQSFYDNVRTYRMQKREYPAKTGTDENKTRTMPYVRTPESPVREQNISKIPMEPRISEKFAHFLRCGGSVSGVIESFYGQPKAK